jgi:hypothetical protein
MTYHSLSGKEKHEITRFMQAMNRALATNSQYVTGMAVVNDDNGYWLEYQGKKLEGAVASGILSQCHLAVFG